MLRCFLVIAAVAIVMPALAVQPLAFELATKGVSNASIALRGDTDIEKLAASELQKYVELVTGAKLPIITGEPGGSIILVADDDPGVSEVYSIDVSTTRVRIRGNCPVTLLFGVYDFLETHLGCRWFAGEEIGEHVPKRPTVRVFTETRVETPSRPVRTFFLRREAEMWWALRNRLNGFYTKEFVDSLGSGTRQSLLYLPSGQGGIHAWYRVVPADTYFDEHPEYFALVNGKRMRGSLRSGQICTTNPDVIALVADAARSYFLEDPNARVFSIAPNDGYGWCECENCQALDEQLGGARVWGQRGHPIVTDRLIHFANQVAEQALVDLPGRELFIFAYVNYVFPPQVVSPAEGVTVWLCHYLPACYAHSISDPNCAENAEFLEYLKTWAQWPDRMGIYAYTDKSMWEGLPRPIVRPMMRDIELFTEYGIPRYVAQSAAANWGQMGALYWVSAKKLWDPTQDLERLLHRWNQGFFGESAEPMSRFVALLEKSVADSGEHFNSSPTVEGPKLFSLDTISQARAILKQAADAAQDEKVRERVDNFSRRFEYGTSYLEYAHLYSTWEAMGDKSVLREAIAVAERLSKQSGSRSESLKNQLPSLYRELETGFLWHGFGPEETKGDRKCWNSDETGLGDNAAGWATFETTLQDREASYLLKLTAWGKSAGLTPVICSKGQGAGYSSGGEWTPLPLLDGRLSGKEQWDELTFRIDPALFDPAGPRQRIGFGGADSQIWIADVNIQKVDE